MINTKSAGISLIEELDAIGVLYITFYSDNIGVVRAFGGKSVLFTVPGVAS